MTSLLSDNASYLLKVIFIGFLLLITPGIGKYNSNFLPSAEAGFFSNDLELFKEVVDLIGDKYIYPPNYKKMFTASIHEMIEALNDKNIIISDNSNGQSISRFNSKIQYKLNFNRQHDLEIFKKAYYFLFEETGGTLSKKELEVAAVTGLMSSLDSYSIFLDTDIFNKSMFDTEGKYGGLGMVITMKDNHLHVLKIMKDSPAQRAGILPGDIFKTVDGKSVKEIQISELASLLRGYPDTKVTISLYRESEKLERTYTLTRKIIFIETVEYETLKNNIGSIRISSFSKQTNDQLKTALAKAKQDKVNSFILDLRNNPGGLLDQSVKVASHFLYRNRLIVYTQGRGDNAYSEYRAKYNNSLHFMPIVILINQNSASAAEIVAGALRDSGKALIIGENSYGKGTVQTIFRTSDGSGLRLTTSKYYTPSGTDITSHGIIPEILITKDHVKKDNPKTEGNLKNKPFEYSSGSLIELKESDIKTFIDKNYDLLAESIDPTLQLAKILIKNTSTANKKEALKKARELAANIDY